MSGLNVKQKRFADFILEGKTQLEAHQLAGYDGKNDNARNASACEILKNPNVQAYIEAMQEKASEATEITLEWLIAESVDLFRKAKADGSHAAANATLKTVGVYTGLWNEKSTRENVNRDVTDYSEEELEALISEGGSRAAGQEESETKPHKLH